jgi:hypothetical protein
MRFVGATSVITGALAMPLLLSAAAPVIAGPVCDELGLSSPCVRSDDLRARINLDQDDTNGRLRVRDADGDNAVELNASNGNVTNLFSNDEDEGNGLVKAWAQINQAGGVIACWRCNKDTDETRRLFAGAYEVDFTPLNTDISGRPRALILDGGPQLPEFAVIRGQIRSGDPSSVLVEAAAAETGDAINTAFTLLIY